MDALNERSKKAALAYHTACAEQYRVFAATASEKLRAKPLEHAKFHDRQATYLRGELEGRRG